MGAPAPPGAAIGAHAAPRDARARPNPAPARRSPRHRPPRPQFRIAALWCGLPLYAIGYYCADFKEKEKLHHRY
jgi:hypothetical protein